MQVEFDIRRLRMLARAAEEGWYKPQAVYGYFPAASEGNDLIVFDPASLGKDLRELTRFTFPRQPAGNQLCLADYFMPLDSGVLDVVALQVVTVGKEPTERFEALDAAAEYSEGFFFHGLAVQLAEATADYLHKQIRRELKMSPEQGLRYSWGYPSIPELEDHRKVFDLLPAEEELGMSLTSANIGARAIHRGDHPAPPRCAVFQRWHQPDRPRLRRVVVAMQSKLWRRLKVKKWRPKNRIKQECENPTSVFGVKMIVPKSQIPHVRYSMPVMT